MRRALVVLLIGLAARTAEAGGLALDLVSPRGVGRAGAALVSDDGIGAVVANPAALARRESQRGQVALVIVDQAARYDAPGPGVVVDARGGSIPTPAVGVAAGVGPVVLGLALLDEGSFSRRFATPSPGQDVADVEALFPHRYAGLSASHARRTLAVGASWRATEWLAIGASLTASWVELTESRRVWAGFDRLQPVGSAGRDVTVEVAGDDRFVPGAVIGALVAPGDVPVELAAAAGWSATAHLGGAAGARAAQLGEPSVALDRPSASASLASPLVVRTGARWLGERWIAEVGGELWAYPDGGAATWAVRGVEVVDATGVRAPVGPLRSQVERRRHGAVRAAIDVEAIAGLLWLTGGWAWASASTSREALTPAAGDLGGHTAAAGFELAAEGFTITVGAARSFATAVGVDVTRLVIDNPFDAGTAPTGLGVHDQGRTVIAATLEVELP